MSFIDHQYPNFLRPIDDVDVQPEDFITQYQHLTLIRFERHERLEIAQPFRFDTVAHHNSFGLGCLPEPFVEFFGPVGHETGGTYHDEASITMKSVVRIYCGDRHESLRCAVDARER